LRRSTVVERHPNQPGGIKEVAVGCSCTGASVFCRSPELAQCAKAACEKGYTLNNWWQSRADADRCAQAWTAKSGIPHYIAESTYVADEAPISRTDYALLSCPRDKVYDDWLRPNAANARICAKQWNTLSQTTGSPIRYEAKRIAARFLFADIWKVVVKE
jgi:hypothetical protein